MPLKKERMTSMMNTILKIAKRWAQRQETASRSLTKETRQYTNSVLTAAPKPNERNAPVFTSTASWTLPVIAHSIASPAIMMLTHRSRNENKFMKSHFFFLFDRVPSNIVTFTRHAKTRSPTLNSLM